VPLPSQDIPFLVCSSMPIGEMQAQAPHRRPFRRPLGRARRNIPEHTGERWPL
jgi:hypothetical protein